MKRVLELILKKAKLLIHWMKNTLWTNDRNAAYWIQNLLVLSNLVHVQFIGLLFIVNA